MTDLGDLDPPIRCFAVVGQFLHHWSAMELSLHAAIGAALQIEPVQLQILCANIHFRDKIHILRTLIDVSQFAASVKDDAKRKTRKLGNHARRRNILAHDPFFPDPKGNGVKFLTVKAKGDFGTDSMVWTQHQFRQEIIALSKYANFLDCLEARFRAHPMRRQNYIDALRPFLSSAPGPNSAAPATLYYQSHHSPDHPDSGPANS